MVTPKQKVSGLDKPYLRGDFSKFATNFMITNWNLVFVTHFIEFRCFGLKETLWG